MRKVTFGGGNSLDNFIAREDHATDWLSWNDEVASVTAEFWKTIDTVVMGRKTYEVARKSATASYSGVKTYVFSRMLKEAPDESVQIVSEESENFVRRLKSQEGKGICIMGGGELARSLLEADLVDEIGLNIHPVLLGRGIPLFHQMSHQIDLELIECKTFKNGCVFISYPVNHRKVQVHSQLSPLRGESELTPSFGVVRGILLVLETSQPLSSTRCCASRGV